MATAFVVSVGIITVQIADDFNGYITALVTCILALGTLRPICENICWALRVIFGLPIKVGSKLSDWLWPDVRIEMRQTSTAETATQDSDVTC